MLPSLPAVHVIGVCSPANITAKQIQEKTLAQDGKNRSVARHVEQRIFVRIGRAVF
jgi:hypothetical protein